MMSDSDFAFIPGQLPSRELPLSHYLPQVPHGIATTWAKRSFPPGCWLVDPFGASPAVTLELAAAGYCVLVASNNPILSFMTEVLARGYKKTDFQAAFSDLAGTRRGTERLEVFLKSLYITTCDSCGQDIPAKTYLWERGATQPFSRLYQCPNCGDEGEHTVTNNDLDQLASIGSSSLHRARALERIGIIAGEIPPGAEDALEAYLPRPLYFLFTLINKIEGLSIKREQRLMLLALALSACDEGSALWSWPSSRVRPKQISISPQFRENNLWFALEDAMQTWSTLEQLATVTHWPELPPTSGGVCLFQGRLKDLLPLPSSIQLSAAVTVLPRPNQAFWTLSAVWAGWLWGREAVKPLKYALERRRYDWQWHATALSHPFNTLADSVPEHFPMLCIQTELSSGFITAVFLSISGSGFTANGSALREGQEILLTSWTKTQKERNATSVTTDQKTCQTAIQSYLELRNEPVNYSLVLTAGLMEMSSRGRLSEIKKRHPADPLATVQAIVNQVITNPVFLKHYQGESQDAESGMWWLAKIKNQPELPLSDRIEMEAIRFLQSHPGCSLKEIDEKLCIEFPGLLTPDPELITTCLESYGEIQSKSPERWRLHIRETPAARRGNLETAQARVKRIGEVLGFSCSGNDPITWVEENCKPVYLFYFVASSIISGYVLELPLLPERRCIIVLPGSRSILITFKLQRDPRLAEAVAAGWRFLKFRHLSRLANLPNLNLEHWERLLDADPPLWKEATQPDMFTS